MVLLPEINLNTSLFFCFKIIPYSDIEYLAQTQLFELCDKQQPQLIWPQQECLKCSLASPPSYQELAQHQIPDQQNSLNDPSMLFGEIFT